jgi:putative FmdB family regulatory protein
MPFYEYQCKNCGHTLEAMQKVNDSPLRKCPECGKSTLQRLMSAPVFRLKGAGWYETDFKSDKDAKRNLADRPEADAPKEDKKESKDDKSESASPKDAPGDSPKPAEKAAEKAPENPAGKTADKPAATPARSNSAKRPPRKKPVKKPSSRPKRRR